MDDPVLRSVPSPGDDTESNSKPKAKSKARPSKPVPTDRMSRKMQVDVLRAFVVASRSGQEPVSADELVAYVKASAATISLNNMFFVDAGLLSREAKGMYKPTAATIEFTRRLSFDDPVAGDALGGPLSHYWAYEVLVRRDEMGPMTVHDAVASMAKAADTDNTYKTQLENILFWMDYAGLIETDGEHITITAPRISASTPGGDDGGPTSAPAATATPAEVPQPTTTKPGQRPIVSFSLDVRLTADDLARLSAEQVQALFVGIGQVAAVQSSQRSED